MKSLQQSPLNPDFVQDPYPTYARARAEGPVMFWQDYDMPAAFDAATVQALLRSRKLGRARPAHLVQPVPPHLTDWAYADDASMLDMEPPRHTRLRNLVLRAFTSRRVNALRPDIEDITRDLLSKLPQDAAFDLIPAFCTALPVRVIARLLGVPEDRAPDLLAWSNAMVAMYQAGRTRAIEDAANSAARAFISFLNDYIEARRRTPRDDLISELIAAEEAGEKLNRQELIGTCILLLNAGHEATVHSLGNAVKSLLEHATSPVALSEPHIATTVEELLRYDPPLHLFTRFAAEDIDLGTVQLKQHDEIALILGAAGRDPALHADADRFDPFRKPLPHVAFGGGLHFCVGTPLARLELQIALPALFAHLPRMALAAPPRYAMSYHFHKLDRLIIQPGPA